ncbi:mucin-3A-like isoform X1 [Hydra vulgaris]|uniref:Mucin-3A-like isoform X1 n=2 Tax=Hydra vulgaris TaxID=6087 RepID=A0ABM4BY90_HYDVU
MKKFWNFCFLFYTALINEALSFKRVSNKCKSGSYYADPQNCNKFFICTNGRKLKFSCPSMLVWDSNFLTCLWSSSTCKLVTPSAQPPNQLPAENLTLSSTKAKHNENKKKHNLVNEFSSFLLVDNKLSTFATKSKLINTPVLSKTQLVALATKPLQITEQLVNKTFSKLAKESELYFPYVTLVSSGAEILTLTESPKETIQIPLITSIPSSYEIKLQPYSVNNVFETESLDLSTEYLKETQLAQFSTSVANLITATDGVTNATAPETKFFFSVTEFKLFSTHILSMIEHFSHVTKFLQETTQIKTHMTFAAKPETVFKQLSTEPLIETTQVATESPKAYVQFNTKLLKETAPVITKYLPQTTLTKLLKKVVLVSTKILPATTPFETESLKKIIVVSTETLNATTPVATKSLKETAVSTKILTATTPFEMESLKETVTVSTKTLKATTPVATESLKKAVLVSTETFKATTPVATESLKKAVFVSTETFKATTPVATESLKKAVLVSTETFKATTPVATESLKKAVLVSTETFKATTPVATESLKKAVLVSTETFKATTPVATESLKKAVLVSTETFKATTPVATESLKKAVLVSTETFKATTPVATESLKKAVLVSTETFKATTPVATESLKKAVLVSTETFKATTPVATESLKKAVFVSTETFKATTPVATESLKKAVLVSTETFKATTPVATETLKATPIERESLKETFLVSAKILSATTSFATESLMEIFIFLTEILTAITPVTTESLKKTAFVSTETLKAITPVTKKSLKKTALVLTEILTTKHLEASEMLQVTNQLKIKMFSAVTNYVAPSVTTYVSKMKTIAKMSEHIELTTKLQLVNKVISVDATQSEILSTGILKKTDRLQQTTVLLHSDVQHKTETYITKSETIYSTKNVERI